MISGVPDQCPAIAIGFAKEIRQVAHAPDPFDARAAAKRLGKIGDLAQNSNKCRSRLERTVVGWSRGKMTPVTVNPSLLGKLITTRRGKGWMAGICGATSRQYA